MPLPTATWISQHGGHSARSRTVTMHLANIGNLAGVQVAGVAATDLVVSGPSTIRFTVPIGPSYQPGVGAIAFVAASDGIARPTPYTFTWKAADGVDRQMAYAFTHWNLYSSTRFGYLSDNDCANFTSQTLLARGWSMNGTWFDYGQWNWSSAWMSSTAMSNWLHKSPQLATHLTYSQRDQAVVGDIVQFNWNAKANPHEWLHTAVVSKVVVLPNGRHDIYYTAHTNNAQYGGSTQTLAEYGSKYLRIQFWHLLK